MPAISYTNTLAKRGKNFAQREPGVILVFGILGSLALLVAYLVIMKKRKESATRREEEDNRRVNARVKMEAPSVA